MLLKLPAVSKEVEQRENASRTVCAVSWEPTQGPGEEAPGTGKQRWAIGGAASTDSEEPWAHNGVAVWSAAIGRKGRDLAGREGMQEYP